MRGHGAHTLLVSGGFHYFTRRVAEAAGFHAEYGNTLLDDGVRLTGKVGEPILGREGKLKALEEAGLQITERVSIEVRSSEPAAKYMQTKKEKMGHLLDLNAR